MASGNGHGHGAMLRLSSASIYEKTFGTRHRGSGRPPGSGAGSGSGAGAGASEGGRAVFPSAAELGVDPLLRTVAVRRAYAVVHEEARERLREVFDAELRVLKRRGVQQVAADAGVRGLGVNGEVLVSAPVSE